MLRLPAGSRAVEMQFTALSFSAPSKVRFVTRLTRDDQEIISTESDRRVAGFLIVSDITMPKLNGIDAMIQIRKDCPSVKVIFLTMHHDAAYAQRALEAGASGFILKHSAPAELVMAIHAASDGKTFITPALAGEVLQAIRHGPPGAADPVATLTPRQRQILQYFAEGLSAKEIADNLGISSRTVEFHKYRMMESLGIENSAELIHFAIKYGLVTA